MATEKHELNDHLVDIIHKSVSAFVRVSAPTPEKRTGEQSSQLSRKTVGDARIQGASKIFLVVGNSLLYMGEVARSGSDDPHMFCTCHKLMWIGATSL